ncbi:MAG: glutaredoxin 3 [Maricaulaceae bacterium]
MRDIVIYTRGCCGYCTRAVALLRGKGVCFEEIEAGFDPEKRKEMIARANGGMTYPQIFIDGRHIGGADDLFALEHSGALDRLLGLGG